MGKIKTLEECKDEIARNNRFNDWNHYTSLHSIGRLVMNAVCEMYADQFKPKWIPVTELLPTRHSLVLVIENIKGLTYPCVLQASWEGNRWRIYGGATAESISYWMPLPEPPKQ